VTPPTQIAIQMLLIAAVAVGLGWWAAGWVGAIGLGCSLAIAVLVSLVWVHRLVGAFGGLSGDMFGAIIEVTTAVCALAGSLALSAAFRVAAF